MGGMLKKSPLADVHREHGARMVEFAGWEMPVQYRSILEEHAAVRERVRNESSTCPICSKDTHGVFNQPIKLMTKKRKILGAVAAQKENSWEKFAEAFSSSTTTKEDDWGGL